MTPFDRQLDRRSLFKLGGAAALSAVVGGALSACASPGTTADVLRVGALLPMTGTNALLGQSSWRGIELAAELRNELGGIAGKRLEVLLTDVPDVNAATSEARRLVFNNNIKLAMGTYSSSLSMAASEVFARTGNSYVELGAVSAGITERGYPRVYRVNPTSQKMADRGFSLMHDFVAPRLGKAPADLKVMMVHEDSSYGQSLAHSAELSAEKFGMSIMALEAYSAKQTDLSSTVARIKSQAPDVVMAVSYAADSVLLGRQLRDADVRLSAFIGCGGGYSMPGFYEALGSVADGVFDTDFPQPRLNPAIAPGLDDFLERYRAKYGGEPDSGYPQVNFTGANFVFDILEATGGDDDPDVFHQAARGFTAETGTTVSGWGFKLDEKNQNERSDHNVMQWFDGKLETVFPPEAAVREAQFITPFSN